MARTSKPKTRNKRASTEETGSVAGPTQNSELSGEDKGSGQNEPNAGIETSNQAPAMVPEAAQTNPVQSPRKKARLTPEEEAIFAENQLKGMVSRTLQSMGSPPVGPKENGGSSATVVDPNDKAQPRYPASPQHHITNVLQSATPNPAKGGANAIFDAAHTEAKKADKRTIKESLMLVIPPDWRGTMPGLLEKIGEEDAALLLAYFAIVYHQGYGAGQFDASRGVNVQRQQRPVQ